MIDALTLVASVPSARNLGSLGLGLYCRLAIFALGLVLATDGRACALPLALIAKIVAPMLHAGHRSSAADHIAHDVAWS